MTRRTAKSRGRRRAPGALPIDKTIGTRIKERRILLGMSQQKLGARLGLTFQQVQKYEKGDNSASGFRLLQLAEILEVPVTWFFDGIELTEAGTKVPALDETVTRETAQLSRHYLGIKNERARRQLFALAKAMAGAA